MRYLTPNWIGIWVVGGDRCDVRAFHGVHDVSLAQVVVAWLLYPFHSLGKLEAEFELERRMAEVEFE
jgi:hypothetical protein